MYRIEISFGHQNYLGRPLSDCRIKWVEKLALSIFTCLFHGGQLHRYQGAYLTKKEQLLFEKSTVIWAYTQEVVKSHLTRVDRLAYLITDLLDQESVLRAIVKLEGELRWVDSDSHLDERVAQQRIQTTTERVFCHRKRLIVNHHLLNETINPLLS